MQAATVVNALQTPSAQAVESLQVGSFLEGLYASCQTRHDANTCHEIVDDAQMLLTEAGFDSLSSIALERLADVIFAATRDWEFIGEDGTIALVAEQRDYTRAVVGDARFQDSYAGLETADGRSYYAPVQ